MKIDELRQEEKLIDLFLTLVQIPSPSLKEDKVADKIIEILKNSGVKVCKDSFGNIKAYVEAADKSKKPILLSAHMDVVGDDSTVNIALKESFIETDKKRTLGADDKAGVAAAMFLAMEVQTDKILKHGGIELVFTKDEEHKMSGIKHLDMNSLESEYILVIDADKLGQVLISGASYSHIILKVKTSKGGHSGIDIADSQRLNAVKLIAELMNEIPQGVYKSNELGVVTSINAGAVIGGGFNSAASKICEENYKSSDYLDFMLKNSMTNIINTEAGVVYSVRSTDLKVEEELTEKITAIVEKFNEKYKSLAHAEIKKEIHLPPFEKSNDNIISETAGKAGEKCGIKLDISSFHAGAETHIYANNVNKYGRKFKPVLLGLADVYNMHSSDEKIDYKSFLKGYNFLKEFFKEFNS